MLIIKSPMKRIHKVMTAVIVKDTISDEKIEILRDNCNNLRDRAMIDFLLSTGIRVGELVRLNIDDIDLKVSSKMAGYKMNLPFNTVYKILYFYK